MIPQIEINISLCSSAKVKEAKDKAESIPNVDLSNLPGVGKRNMDGLMNGYVNPAVLNYLSNRQGIFYLLLVYTYHTGE